MEYSHFVYTVYDKFTQNNQLQILIVGHTKWI